ncbi:MAG: LacI family DNA-binding transcriptional regulator [Planctomycetota bacterium]|jgi:LacI family transcriptional regulator
MPENGPIAKLSRHLLYEEVAASIRQLIRERGLWGTYLPPERELASMFGVNRGTVRKGLQALEEQGVISRRQGQGTLVVPRPQNGKRSREARVIVASFVRLPVTEGFYGEIMAGITLGASDADWNVVFHSGLRDTERWTRFIADLADEMLDGLVLVSFTRHSVVEEVLTHWKGPAVLVDHYFGDLPLTGVIDDSRAGARRATEHLLGLGHRRIGYIDVSDPATNPWRYSGYAEALRAAGVEPNPGLRAGCHADMEQARDAAARLLSLPEPPTAVLAFDDTRAWGVWRAAEERGLAVGRDFALVGYGDAGDPPTGRPAELSSVRINPQFMGESAVRELDKLIAGRAQAGEQVLLPAELVVRGSSRDARPRAAAS